MRIAFLAPRFHSNQAKLVEYLVSKNNFLEFYVTRIGKSEDHTLLKPTIIKFNYFFKIIKKMVKSNNVLFDYTYGLPSIKELVIFKRNNFDVIVIRSPYSFIAMSYAIFCKFIGVRIVFYTQREIHRKKNRIKDFFVKSLIKIFNAKWISPCLGNLKYDKIIKEMYYVPFCMDVTEYKKEWFKNDCIHIISIGKFVKRKNHHLLIRALNPLASKYKFNLTIIGEVSKVTGKEYYLDIVSTSKKSPYRIIIKKNLERKEVFEEYKKSDIFVLPSKNEPASVSNLEAMSFGLPIITSDTNMTSSYTKDNGLIFSSDSESDLKSKLNILLKNKNLIREMGLKSLNVVKKNHSSSTTYQYLLENVFKN